uniref:Uncharacterized protein n=1 Tax=Arundo donax TaxID=35708 RepID=A0A0A9FSY8_ARUDO
MNAYEFLFIFSPSRCVIDQKCLIRVLQLYSIYSQQTTRCHAKMNVVCNEKKGK